MLIALTRAVSPRLAECELTHLVRRPIDVALAGQQHELYEAALTDLGCSVRQLPAESALPDSVFVEDTAIVLDEVAVITHPGAASRRAETGSVATVLGEYRELLRMMAPATLDGGDVLRLGRHLYVGQSARSSAAGIRQLAELLARFDYRIHAVPLRGCLHLKTAVTQVGPDLLLLNPAWVEARHFPGMHALEVEAEEPSAANALLINGRLIYPASCPRTRARLEAQGIETVGVDMSETEKAEGGVTCCSLIFDWGN